MSARRSSRGSAPTKQVLELTIAEKRHFRRPRCLCYGPNRHEIDEWKQYFFCGQCDLVDQHRSAEGRYPDLNTARNKCIANHKYWDRPSDTGGDKNNDPPFISNLAIHRYEGGDGSVVNGILSALDGADWKESQVDASFSYMIDKAPKNKDITFYLAYKTDADGRSCNDDDECELVGVVGLETNERRRGRRSNGRSDNHYQNTCIALMWTKIEYQRQGVATATLHAALKGRNDISVVTSTALPSAKGRAFYARYGFKGGCGDICYYLKLGRFLQKLEEELRYTPRRSSQRISISTDVEALYRRTDESSDGSGSGSAGNGSSGSTGNGSGSGSTGNGSGSGSTGNGSGSGSTGNGISGSAGNGSSGSTGNGSSGSIGNGSTDSARSGSTGSGSTGSGSRTIAVARTPVGRTPSPSTGKRQRDYSDIGSTSSSKKGRKKSPAPIAMTEILLDNNSRLREKIKDLEATILELKSEAENAAKLHQQRLATKKSLYNRQNKRAQRAEELLAAAMTQADELQKKPDSFSGGLVMWIEHYVRKYWPTTGAKTRSKEITKAAVTCLGGVALPGVRQHVVEELQKIFSPQRMLKAFDLGDGNVNNAALRLVRKIGWESGIKVYRDIVPSDYAMKGARNRVEVLAEQLCPIVEIQTSMGPGVRFACDKQVGLLIIKAFGLLEAGKRRPLTIAVATDGTKLTNHISLMVTGVKMMDTGCRNSLIPTQKMVKGQLRLGMQSRDLCFPTCLILSKETEEAYEDARPTYEFWEEAATPTADGSSKAFEAEGLKPVQYEAAADLSGQWKGTKKGGGAKNKERFCHLKCNVKSGDIDKPCSTTCDKCNNVKDAGAYRHKHLIEAWECYHPETSVELTESKIKDAETRIKADIDDTKKYLEELRGKTKIKKYPDPTDAEDKSDSIDFQPASSDEENDFLDLLLDEYEARDMEAPHGATVQELLPELRGQIEAEEELLELLETLDHLRDVPGALYLVARVTPCILHGTRRINIKMLGELLNEGMANAVSGKLYPGENSKTRRIARFTKEVEDIFNKQILGDEETPGHFVLRHEENQDKTPIVSPINIEGDRLRKLVKKLDPLIDAIILEKTERDEHRRERWKACINEWLPAVEILHKEGIKYTDDELQKYWDHINHWFILYNSLTGYGGMTNYTHIYVVHMYEYMATKGCLYRYSQQGWEALNKLIRNWFFRRTNRGGGRGRRSKLIPLGKLLQRRLLWLSGDADRLFEEGADDAVGAAAGTAVEADGSQGVGTVELVGTSMADVPLDDDDLHFGGDMTIGAI